MKKIKLITASVSVLLLVSTLVLGGGVLGGYSQAQAYEIKSDVICGIGGGAQSDSFTLKASAGAQGSPVGPQSSENYTAGGGWVYTTEEEGNRGDVNGDGVINVGDVVYLVSYLYREGPPPDPSWVGDANSDGVVDVGDVVYLVSYLYRGGPPPCSPGGGREILASVSRLKGSAGHVQISLALKTDPAKENLPNFAKACPGGLDEVLEISVWGNFDCHVAGIELEIAFNPDEVTLLDPALTPLTKGLQLFSGIKDKTQKIGMVDLSGKNLVPAGEGVLVNLRAKGSDLTSIKIKKATLVDRDAVPLALELSGELNLEMAKGSIPLKQDLQESTPRHFSLSQNYPNPFNPETEISYALPTDCHVKLIIYNVAGQKVKTLVDGHQTVGYKSIHWNGKDDQGKEIASGVYFYRIQANDFSQSQKMVLLR